MKNDSIASVLVESVISRINIDQLSMAIRVLETPGLSDDVLMDPSLHKAVLDLLYSSLGKSYYLTGEHLQNVLQIIKICKISPKVVDGVIFKYVASYISGNKKFPGSFFEIVKVFNPDKEVFNNGKIKEVAKKTIENTGNKYHLIPLRMLWTLMTCFDLPKETKRIGVSQGLYLIDSDVENYKVYINDIFTLSGLSDAEVSIEIQAALVRALKEGEVGSLRRLIKIFPDMAKSFLVKESTKNNAALLIMKLFEDGQLGSIKELCNMTGLGDLTEYISQEAIRTQLSSLLKNGNDHAAIYLIEIAKVSDEVAAQCFIENFESVMCLTDSTKRVKEYALKYGISDYLLKVGATKRVYRCLDSYKPSLALKVMKEFGLSDDILETEEARLAAKSGMMKIIKSSDSEELWFLIETFGFKI